jgi:hypothetical protein
MPQAATPFMDGAIVITIPRSNSVKCSGSLPKNYQHFGAVQYLTNSTKEKVFNFTQQNVVRTFGFNMTFIVTMRFALIMFGRQKVQYSTEDLKNLSHLRQTQPATQKKL